MNRVVISDRIVLLYRVELISKLNFTFHYRISRSPSISLLSHRGGHGKSPEKQDVGGVGKGLVGEKDSKLDGKRRKAEESVKKADVEYYQLCVRAERAR